MVSHIFLRIATAKQNHKVKIRGAAIPVPPAPSMNDMNQGRGLMSGGIAVLDPLSSPGRTRATNEACHQSPIFQKEHPKAQEVTSTKALQDRAMFFVAKVAKNQNQKISKLILCHEGLPGNSK